MKTGKGKTYISGPMTGLPSNNYPAFVEAEKWLKSIGYEVVNPAKITDSGGCHSHEWYMRKSLKMLLQCENIHLLKGWHKSPGAIMEVKVAVACGINFVEEGKRMRNDNR